LAPAAASKDICNGRFVSIRAETPAILALSWTQQQQGHSNKSGASNNKYASKKAETIVETPARWKRMKHKAKRRKEGMCELLKVKKSQERKEKLCE
jgi:hypothetical protein